MNLENNALDELTYNELKKVVKELEKENNKFLKQNTETDQCLSTV